MSFRATRLPVLAQLLALCGCGGGFSVDGHWSVVCAAADPVYYTSDLRVAKDTWELTAAFAADQFCLQRGVTYRQTGTLTTGKVSSLGPNAREVDFAVQGRFLTVHAEEARGLLSLVGCDASSFPLNVEQDLSAQGCGNLAPSVEACPAEYDVVQVDGDALLRGKRPDDADLCTPDRRPTALETAVKWSRVDA